jgi:predicted nucleotidyltransferase/DNA-binding XRE family transcriptional regulator
MRSGALIRAARVDAGLTQAALARAAGTSQPTIARYESGRSEPRASTLERILAACGQRLEPTGAPVVTTQVPARGPRGRLLRRHAAEVRAVIEAAGLRNPRVFGSVARGEDTEDSDIDILVDLVDETDLLAIGPPMDELTELLGLRVDVICPQVARPSVLEGALRDAIVL